MSHPSSLRTEIDAQEPRRVVFDGDARLTVVGPCFADATQPRDGLRHVRAGRWAALTARLLCPTVPEVAEDGTAFTGVRRVPGGHALVIHGDSTHTVTPYEQPRRLPFAEAAQELREALVTAVQARVQAAYRPTADFSGGLDSTSLAILATGKADMELLAVTHADSTSRNEDVVYAQRAAAGRPGLHHELVTDAEGLFFANLLDAPATDQPFPDAARWRMRAAYQRPCMEHGSDLHLSGSGADTLLSASPYYLADLARERETAALLRRSLARARLRHLPLYAVVAGAVRLSRTTHSLALQRLAYGIAANPAVTRPDPPARLHWVRASGVHAWLTPDARRHLALRAAEAAERCSVEPQDISCHRAWAELREFGTYEAELRNQAHRMGLIHHAPFLDNAVVRAAMAVPVAARASTTAQKPLLGAALGGLVPEWLLARRTKGAYDGNAYTGLRRHADVLRGLLTDSRLAAEGWIDATAVLAELDRLAAGVPGKLAALEALVTTELWLHQQRTAQPDGHRAEVAHA